MARVAPYRLSGAAFASLLLAGCGLVLTPHHRLERAQKEIQAGEWKDAAVDLQVVVQKEPNNVQAWLLLAQLSLDAADVNGAESGLKHAVDAGAKGPQVDALRANIWLAEGPKEHQALLDAITKHTLQLPEPDQTLDAARALIALNQPDEAIAKLQPLIAEHPDLTDAHQALAEALVEESKFGPALKELDGAMQRDPKSAELPLLKGLTLKRLGQYALAEDALQLAMKRMQPTEPLLHRLQALVALGEVRLARGETDTAAQSAAAVMKLAPQAPATMVLDARVKIARKNLVGAVSELEQVVLNAPSYYDARLLLGATLLQRGDLQQALQQLDQVIQSTPDGTPENLQGRELLAQVQLRLGQPQEAMAILDPALSTDTLDPQLLSLYGTAASRAGDKRALIEALQRSAKDHPNDQPVLLNLAAAYLATGQAEQALGVIQKTTDNGDPRRDRLLISALIATKGPGAAGDEVETLLKAHPHDSGMLDLAASYYVSQDQPQRARATLKEAVAVNADDTDAIVALAQLEERGGDSAAAQSRLQAALKAHPTALPVRMALADSLVQAKDFDGARSVLEAAGPEGGANVQLALAQVALARGDLKSANATLDSTIAANPGRTDLIEDAGRVLMQGNQYDAALARFAQATQLTPTNAEYWFNTARAQLALNEPQAARSSLNKADGLQPYSPPVVGMLALLDAGQGQSQSALARVQGLMIRRPNDPVVLELQGDVEMALKDPTKAADAYQNAQRLRPSAELAAKLYRVRLATHAPDPQAPLEQWLTRDPQSWPIHDMLGEYYLGVGNVRSAVKEFQAAVAVNGDDVLGLNNLAWSLDQLRDPGAEAIAQRAYRLAPNVANVNDTLGWILARGSQPAGAVDYLRHAAQLDPNDPNIQYHLAYALAKTGQGGEARQILGKILATGKPFDARRDAQRLLTSVTG
jgi:putative PEP-CTERM system TPR-repeat lipoprotein